MIELGIARSIARLDGLDNTDLRDLLEPEDTRDTDDDDAAEERGDMDAGLSSAPKSSNGAEGADRDCRPDSAARGVASASGLVTSLSSTMSLTIFSFVLGADFDPLYSPQLRFEGGNESRSGVGYKRFDDLAPILVSSPSRVELDTEIQCSIPAVSYMPHVACWLFLNG